MSFSYAEFTPVFKALADETRLRIIGMLSGGELCACKILEEFDISQPTLSYHMKVLSDCGLVIGVRSGAWMYYSINRKRVAEINRFLKNLSNVDEGGCCK